MGGGGPSLLFSFVVVVVGEKESFKSHAMALHGVASSVEIGGGGEPAGRGAQEPPRVEEVGSLVSVSPL